MSITLDQVTKHYGGAPVVNDVSLDIGDGEFFVLLGPSGSGKSTLLRAIAGLSGVDHGRISLHGRDVTHVAARKRGVGLVFQNYALFRHMTVADNIEFALRVRHMRARARRARREELLRLVALEGMDDRLPAQLSGGQQQRVAVARALAHKPEVLLLDEPFGALDAKIREELRRTIRQVQRELGITTVLVTHDQEEAFAMADRIGIMNQGRLLEVGAPHELYARPATRFVATFLGAANLFLARRTPDGIQVGGKTMGSAERAPGAPEHEVVAVVRPEEVELAAARESLGSRYLGNGVIDEITFTGALERLRVQLDEAVHAPLLAASDADARALQVTRTRQVNRGFEVQQGQTVAVGLRRVHVLPTPISSFTACAPSALRADVLSRQPLLAELVARMKTRVAVRIEPALGHTDAPCEAQGEFFGTTVIAAEGDNVERAEWLLRRGVKDLLVLPEAAAPPQRVLIHWMGEAARSATLAVSASVLRHVPAEAVYLGIFPGRSDSERHSYGMRELLDARSEAQAAHGLEMRTELHFGDVAQELTRRLAEAPAQMLIVGVTELKHFAQGFRALLDGGRWPVLIVQRGAP
ncbi:MAG: ABC transporter ATP-binding protein [Gammaproteobacteria bacterium]|nr:ABC transporter ATP-binding protein [Gammaproteobacteria bacterium]MBV9726857.1 ABC transporter ATP-binding protein [Gammaproteobacteria bacterium]